MYTVVNSIEEVNELINEWWICQWWCSYVLTPDNRPYLCQAMIKTNQKEKKKPWDKSIREDLQRFVSAWNNVRSIWRLKWLRKVEVITPTMEREWKKLVDEFKDLSLIEKSIDTYIGEISDRREREWSDYHLHRFTFDQFIKQANWARRFINF